MPKLNNYDRVAKIYAKKFKDELDDKPKDREWLDLLIQRVDKLGPICDLGCAGGQIAAYLHTHGAHALGVDLSSKMIEQARKLNPQIPFEQGDILNLPLEESTLGGIAAFYSLIHVEPKHIPIALSELKRVLKPGGWVLLSFHIGEQVLHLDTWYKKQVNLDFHFFQIEQMTDWLQEAGLQNIEAHERDPYIGYEHESQRGYVFAQYPGFNGN